MDLDEWIAKANEEARAAGERAERLAQRIGHERAWWVLERGDPCADCGGSGIKGYSSTTLHRGGIGGQALRSGQCDRCWGSGVEGKPWRSPSATQSA